MSIYVYKCTEGQERIKTDSVNDTKDLIKLEIWKMEHWGIKGTVAIVFYDMQQNNLKTPKHK